MFSDLIKEENIEMVNTLRMDKKSLLERLFESGWSSRKINNATGLNRRTISKYRRLWEANKELDESEDKDKGDPPDVPITSTNPSQNAPPKGGVKCPPGGVVHFEVPTDPLEAVIQESRSQVAVYNQKIRSKLKKGLTARRIYQDLYVEEDYRGSYDSVKRYVRKLKQKAPKLYARLETLPGEESQVDFGKGAPSLKNGRYVKPWVFVMTLSNSRGSYEEAVWAQDVETFIRCHERAFFELGGCVKIIRHDNLKSAVLKAHLYEPEMNPLYVAFSEHYGFVPIPCRVRTPEHQGKVESGVNYVKSNALKGRKFESLEAQNKYLRFWNRTWAQTRIHGTTKRQVKKMFSEEKPHLKPLPERAFAFFQISTRKVNSLDSYIEVKGAYYPIPPKFMGKTVDVHFNSQWVKVYYKGHRIQWLYTIEKGRFHPDKSCLPLNKALDRNGFQTRLLEQCSDLGVEIRRWADEAVADRGLPAYRAIQGVVRLKEKYSLEVLGAACELALKRLAFNYHLVRHYAEEVALKTIQTQLQLSQDSDLIRSPGAYADLLEERVRS